jgi:hypothetical protein
MIQTIVITIIIRLLEIEIITTALSTDDPTTNTTITTRLEQIITMNAIMAVHANVNVHNNNKNNFIKRTLI